MKNSKEVIGTKMKRIPIEKYRDKLEKIIGEYNRYNSFIRDREKAFEYSKIFDIKICPYCNINYIYTVTTKNGEPIVRPDFDHFMLRNKENELSIDNLVPCCPICNSRLKKATPITAKTHLHPFKEDFDEIADFYVDINSLDYLNENSFLIKIKAKENTLKKLWDKANNNITLFALEDRYNFHKDIVVDIFRDIKYYYEEKLDEIDKIINSNGYLITNQRLEEYKNIEINQVSLGKLKKDITTKYTR